MHIEIHELSFNELDQVSGCGPIEWLAGFIAGKVVETIVTAKELHADQRDERSARRNRSKTGLISNPRGRLSWRPLSFACRARGLGSHSRIETALGAISACGFMCLLCPLRR